MSFAIRDGVRLFYQQDGSEAPPLVFIHGWCCDHTFFQPLYDHFKSSHTVVTLDLRGCGRSDQPEDGYDIPSLADDVAWLCGELKLSAPILVGHSLGGMVAIELSARYPTLPAAIVAVDPGPIHPLPETRLIYEGFLEQMQGPDGEAVRQAWVEHSFLPTDDADRKSWVVEKMCSVPLSVAVAGIRGVVEWNGVAALALCEVPLLVLRSQPGGSNDPARLAAIKPDIHVGITIGAGHFHQLEVPEQVIPMMERFFRIAGKKTAG